MKYNLLGKTGIKVSSLCMGTMSFGGIADETESKKMFNRCLDLGINFFDSACNYNNGKSEEILGKLMKGKRDDLIITSKVYYPTGDNINDKGLSRRHILMEVEDSLTRLGTDRIDLYFVHKFDKNTYIEETLRALDDLQRQGKIVYAAVSNWAAWQIAKALGISAKESLARFECIQPMYNLVKRQVEVEILPLANSEKLGVVSYSPLGGGLLTGKYLKEDTSGRIVEDPRYKARYGEDKYFTVTKNFVEHAKEKGVTPATLAVAWVMNHPDITSPLIGARNVEQLEASLDAINIDMTPEWRQEITEISAPVAPAPATDRSEGSKFD